MDIREPRFAGLIEKLAFVLAFAVALTGPAPYRTPDDIPIIIASLIAGIIVTYIWCYSLKRQNKYTGWYLILILSCLASLGFFIFDRPMSWFSIVTITVITIEISAFPLVDWIAKNNEPGSTRSYVDKNSDSSTAYKSKKYFLLQFFLAPQEMPWLLIALPSLFVVLASGVCEPPSLQIFTIVAFLATGCLIGLMHFRPEELYFTRIYFKRLLSEGYGKYLSVIIVLLAIARLADQKQVTLLLNNSSFTVVGQLIISSLLLTMLVDNWHRRRLCNSLKDKIDNDENNDIKIRIINGGDFLVKDKVAPWKPMPWWELLNRLKYTKTSDTQKLRNKFNSYNLAGQVIASTLVALITIAISTDLLVISKKPVIIVNPEIVEHSLEFYLSKGKKPPILIAASGGGTRAALYTYAVLRGLQESEELDRVVLYSGVSGGSIAIAGFLERIQKLTDKNEEIHKAAWVEYFDAMAHPYIDDVIVKSTQFHRGYDLSHHLRDSIKAQISPGTDSKGIGKDIGVIFNTTIAGDDDMTHQRKYSGGRLVISNIQELTTDVSICDKNKQDKPLFIGLYDHSIPAAFAASLSANFPVVFPDAAVQIQCGKGKSNANKIYVTDGGVMDNRGVISILRALSVLQEKGSDALKNPAYPITILSIDASAISSKYEPARGLSTIGDSQLLLATEYIRTQLSNINEKIENDNKIEYIELKMPDKLRDTDAFTTHLKVPYKTKVKCSEDDVKGDGLYSKELLTVIGDMFLPVDKKRESILPEQCLLIDTADPEAPEEKCTPCQALEKALRQSKVCLTLESSCLPSTASAL